MGQRDPRKNLSFLSDQSPWPVETEDRWSLRQWAICGRGTPVVLEKEDYKNASGWSYRETGHGQTLSLPRKCHCCQDSSKDPKIKTESKAGKDGHCFKKWNYCGHRKWS